MNDLLARVIAAHGGLERWRDVEMVKATIVTGGAFWGMKGVVQDSEPRQMAVWLHDQRASVTPFGNPNWRTSFGPGRIAIETLNGGVVSERFDPRSAFEGHEQMTPWDPLHRAYFNGYALWTYLTTPFLLADPEVEVFELEPWREGGETWRRLRAHFPTHMVTHSVVQDFYFDKASMLIRHDYQVDIAGGFAAAQRIYGYTQVNGLLMPTRRRAFQKSADGRIIEDPVMVSIDLSNFQFT